MSTSESRILLPLLLGAVALGTLAALPENTRARIGAYFAAAGEAYRTAAHSHPFLGAQVAAGKLALWYEGWNGERYMPSEVDDVPLYGGGEPTFNPYSPPNPDEHVLYDPYDPAWYDPELDGPIDPYDPPWYDPELDGPIDPYDPPWYEPELGPVVYEEWYEYEPVAQSSSSYWGDTWYSRALPGWGGTISSLLPPSLRPQQPQPAPPAPAPQQPQPTCELRAQPAQVRSGASVTLHWTSRNATAASLAGVGGVAISGSRTVHNVTESQTFGLTVRGRGGINACYAAVSVVKDTRKPECVISARPASVRRGESATIAWGSEHASSAVLQGYGPVQTFGSREVRPGQNATYALVVYGPAGSSASCSTSVDVR